MTVAECNVRPFLSLYVRHYLQVPFFIQLDDGMHSKISRRPGLASKDMVEIQLPSYMFYTSTIVSSRWTALTKLSVLAFYRRIFSVTRHLKITIFVGGVAVIIWWITFTITGMLACVPIQAFWDLRLGVIVCKNIVAFLLWPY